MEWFGWGLPIVSATVTPPTAPRGPYPGPWLYLTPNVYPGGVALPVEMFPGPDTYPSSTTYLTD
ncbi:hypothetical protein SAMN05443544_0586 [Agromyces cerinus subsp. cerinus]|uniref:Uncharacterized protein n=1 Tax=Agromyces cerinus subsp. cerinus TaxID=232089 RepID=A0A1N6DQC3_9MICO|nr:hypothetical protein SAMN05443544_0586 [Agromyces cerinus subsp. cerinus]